VSSADDGRREVGFRLQTCKREKSRFSALVRSGPDRQ